jgi:N-acetylglucosamine-6-phosphate deacetylase
MLPIASREPGLLGAALSTGIYVELIPNPEMVHPVVSQVVGAAVDPDRLILVSDCLASMTFAGANRSGSGLSYTRDGIVLGGASSLGDLLPHAKPILRGSLVALVRASSQNALCHLGLASTWPLEVGMDASFLVIDERWQVQAVVREGKLLRPRDLTR